MQDLGGKAPLCCRHATISQLAEGVALRMQVARMAKELEAPMLAAASAKQQLQAERRAAVEAVTPRRRSMRSSAQQTRALLSRQAQRAGEDSDEEESGRLSNSDEDVAATDEGHLSKRHRSGEEGEDYDPVADMSEQEGGSQDEASEDEVGVEHEKEAEAVYKRPRKSKASAPKAGGLSRGSTDRPSVPLGDSSDEDAELQQALAMSLMEAHLGFNKSDQGQTSAAAAPSERSNPGADAQKETVPTASMPQGAQEEDDAAVRGAAKKASANSKGKMRAGDEGAQQKVPNGKGTGDKKGGGRKRAPAPLVASPEDVRSAFAVLAGSRSVITPQSLKMVSLAVFAVVQPIPMCWTPGRSGSAAINGPGCCSDMGAVAGRLGMRCGVERCQRAAWRIC